MLSGVWYLLKKDCGMTRDLSGQEWRKKREEVWENQEGQKSKHVEDHIDIALATGQGKANAL